MTTRTDSQDSPAAPDPILAELWEVKYAINKEADYRIDILVDMANEAAERVRAQWRQEAKHPRERRVNSEGRDRRGQE